MFEMRNTTLGFNVSNKKQERAVSAMVSSSNFLKQSPKIQSGKYRQELSGKGEDKLFSLLDIPIQKVARSFKMPVQYERPQSVCPQSKPEEKENTDPIKKVTERNIRTAIGGARPDHNDNIIEYFPPHASNSRLSRTSHSFRENSKTPSAKEIRQNMDKSDIFFLKKDKTENYQTRHEFNNNRNQTKYMNSDIFMLKNDKDNLDKCGERFLFKKIGNVYDTSTKSNSEWKDKNMYQNLLGHSSRSYHLLNPDVRNISKTKQEIINEANGYNPIYRQKSLCEFIDLNRVGVPNPNKVYLNAAKTSRNPFGRNTNICASYYDIHGQYRNLSEKPFIK